MVGSADPSPGDDADPLLKYRPLFNLGAPRAGAGAPNPFSENGERILSNLWKRLDQWTSDTKAGKAVLNLVTLAMAVAMALMSYSLGAAQQ